MKKMILLSLLTVGFTNQTFGSSFEDSLNCDKCQKTVSNTPAIHGVFTAGVVTCSAFNFFNFQAIAAAEMKKINPTTALKVFSFPYLSPTQSSWVKASLVGFLAGSLIWKISQQSQKISELLSIIGYNQEKRYSDSDDSDSDDSDSDDCRPVSRSTRAPFSSSMPTTQESRSEFSSASKPGNYGFTENFRCYNESSSLADDSQSD